MTRLASALLLLLTAVPLLAEPAPTASFSAGRPEIRSLSALSFGPEGVLFVGDGKGGAVFALDLGPRATRAVEKPQGVSDVEGRLAALLGATPADVMIHDMAVDPLGKDVYFAVSRGRAAWNAQWLLPNDVADADVLVRMGPDGTPALVDLASVRHARVTLPNPVDAAKMVPWKKASLRADTITDMAFSDGVLYVAGLSNEEFASTMWSVKYPFAGAVSATTVENYHGAHGKYETEAPVRTFVPYPLKGKAHLLAAYLCTPLVTIPVADIQGGKHIRGRTVAEFGSGNYPLDMLLVRNDKGEKVVIANNNLPLLVVDTKDIESYPAAIDSHVETYTAGVRFIARSGTGIQQMDHLGDKHLLFLQRLPGGQLDLRPTSVQGF